MDRFTFTDESGFQPGRVTLDIEFAAGTSGAVPTDLADYVRSNGIDSMELAATGVYTVHLSDSYVALIGGTFSVQQATYSASAGQEGYVIDTGTDVTDSDDPSVTFQCTQPGTGAATAAVSGDIVRITLTLQRLQGI